MGNLAELVRSCVKILARVQQFCTSLSDDCLKSCSVTACLLGLLLSAAGRAGRQHVKSTRYCSANLPIDYGVCNGSLRCVGRRAAAPRRRPPYSARARVARAAGGSRNSDRQLLVVVILRVFSPRRAARLYGVAPVIGVVVPALQPKKTPAAESSDYGRAHYRAN